MNQCPICGNPYIKAKPTQSGGMEYIHEEKETFKEVCTQSAASLKAAEVNAEMIPTPKTNRRNNIMRPTDLE